MFEGAFNLAYNLHKSYVSVGIDDDDIARLGAVYGLSAAEVEELFCQYAAENQKNAMLVSQKIDLSKIDRQAKIRIAYLGDSITSYRMSHQRIAAAALAGYESIDIEDFAISGYKVGDVLTALYPHVSGFTPHIAVLMIGTNDYRIVDDRFRITHTSIEEFERDYRYILQSLQDMGCKPLAVTLPPFDAKKIAVALEGWKALFTEESRNAYDDVILKTSKELGVLLVDMRDKYNQYDAADITDEDGLHLNPKGQRLLAEQVVEQMAPLLEQAGRART